MTRQCHPRRYRSRFVSRLGPGVAGVVLLAAVMGAATDRPTVTIAPADCTSGGCHAAVKDHEIVHGPVTVNACDACHVPADPTAHTFTMAREAQAMCTFCHEPQTEGMKVIHKPMRDGDCLQCHSPHGGATFSMLRAASADALCRQCHEDVIGGRGYVHGPVAAGVCGACHTPHASQYPNLLNAEGAQVCVACHASTREQMLNSRYVHGPAAVDCQVCHDAHASDQPMMVRQQPQVLCLSCHETIKHQVEEARTKHDAVVTDRACLNCHEPHASNEPRVLKGKMLDLCMECHDREIPMPDGATLGNMKKVLASGKSLHGPVAQDNCAACHVIHGGDNFRLLTREYPAKFYAPFDEQSYALCFMCHDAQIVRDEQTTALTDFRNGQVNLHYLHVHRDKGRTCRACHETHASSREKHIRDAVPFGTGGWQLPINYEKRDDGGSCAPGCHLPYAYDRVRPVVYAESAEGQPQPTPPSPEESNP